jgi:hypothetical protein
MGTPCVLCIGLGSEVLVVVGGGGGVPVGEGVGGGRGSELGPALRGPCCSRGSLSESVWGNLGRATPPPPIWVVFVMQR